MNAHAEGQATRPGLDITGQRRPRVVIVGAGFGGLSAARRFARAPFDIIVVDRRNYHLFQPLLYQVATAGLAPSEIATPIRAILRHHKNVTVLMDRVTGVDVAGKAIVTGRQRIAYDHLIIATGARHDYFGNDHWEDNAPGLKKIDDATRIRRRILSAFEEAENERDERRRRHLLTFAVVGGGPTGVELAGAIAELARHGLARDFRYVDPRDARVLLVEAGSRILSALPDKLAGAAASALSALGVEVLCGRPVTSCDGEGLIVGDERMPAATVLWAAGVRASPAAKWLGAVCDAAGRVIVEHDMTVPGHPEIHVIGDTASVTGPTGRPLPGIAPVAKQQGEYVARAILAQYGLRSRPGTFRYRDLGSMATVGRRAAVADFGWFQLSGLLAWLLWGFVHIYFLIGFRNRVTVMLDWAWAYVTFQQGSRLITGSDE